jgi:hypothetical protein
MYAWATGARFSKEFTSHDLRRTVATQLAEALEDQGDKLVKRVLGHADGGVTAIYNRYAYVREMRRVLEAWANDLAMRPAPLQHPVTPTTITQAASACRRDLIQGAFDGEDILITAGRAIEPHRQVSIPDVQFDARPLS